MTDLQIAAIPRLGTTTLPYDPSTTATRSFKLNLAHELLHCHPRSIDRVSLTKKDVTAQARTVTRYSGIPSQVGRL